MTTYTWPRWLKWLKRIAFLIAVLITCGALALAIENYRARRAWDACKSELEARGEKLGWRDLLPASVPDDQNFLATPLLAACFGYGGQSTNLAASEGDTNACLQIRQLFPWSGMLPGPEDWSTATIESTVADWQKRLRATNDIRVETMMVQRHGLSPSQVTAQLALNNNDLAALRQRPWGSAVEDLRFLLAQNQDELDELRAASHRPFSQMNMGTPGVFSGRLMVQLAAFRSLIHPFRVSIWTELAGGNPAGASEDLQTMLSLADAAGSEPLLIAALVKVAIVELSLRNLWVGLVGHHWPEAQLVELESRLGRLNIVADMKRCLRGDRAFALASLGGGSNYGDPSSSATENNPMRHAIRHWPAALIYRNQINVARAYQCLLIDRLDPNGPVIHLAHDDNVNLERRRFMAWSPYNLFTPLLLPAVEKSLEKAAASQASVSLARVACALERYRLATGQYPESLDELTPHFIAALPPDPVNGEALKYRREAPDRFILYSVALNLKDDGGRLDRKGQWPWGLKILDQDWIWSSDAFVERP